MELPCNPQRMHARLERLRRAALRRLAGWIERRFPDVRWMDPDEMGRACLLDARRLEEFRVSHLAGAEPVEPLGRVPGEALTDLVSRLRGRADPVVVYCSVGYRSARLAEALTRAGVPSVYSLRAGIFGWALDRRPLDGDANGRVHPFNALFGLLLEPALRARSSSPSGTEPSIRPEP